MGYSFSRIAKRYFSDDKSYAWEEQIDANINRENREKLKEEAELAKKAKGESKKSKHDMSLQILVKDERIRCLEKELKTLKEQPFSEQDNKLFMDNEHVRNIKKLIMLIKECGVPEKMKNAFEKIEAYYKFR